MHVLFEEDGAFRAGSVLSDAGATLQVELPSGKRSKLKAAQVMVRFAEPGPTEYLQRAQQVADAIDLDFLWECAPQDEFGFQDLAAEYFGQSATPIEAGGLLLRLHAAPVHFHRKGKGRYRPASPETLRAALAGIERKRQQAITIEQWAGELAAGRLPEPIGARAAELLVRPDKNTVEWKALERACEIAKSAPQPLLLAAGAFASPRALHVERFRVEQFASGFGFAALGEAPPWPHDLDARLAALPLSEAVTFSIDDSMTTEIDDCLSVSTLPDGRLRVGVHIAAPGLGIEPGSPVDRAARARMSTVYMPGDKITMMPPEAVARFSLDAGREVPALSLYVDLADDGVTVVDSHSRAERIRVADNLRHDTLDAVVTEAALDGADPGTGPLPHGQALRALWRFCKALSAERERVRGRPEPRGRADFTFYVDGDTVRIVERRRDAPLDRIVAEMAILANSRWGRLLADHGAPGIYRSQAPMGRVRMGTHPLPHQQLGVAQYAWCTSPLRRYVDLVNQRQVLAVLDGRAPPYAPQDADLFAVIGAFDAKYAAYGEFQQRMERYWCLRWLAQQDAERVEAVVVRDELARLAHAPFFFRMADLPALAPGRRILVDVLGTDEIELVLQARFAGVVEGAPDAAAEVEPFDEELAPDVAVESGEVVEAGKAAEAAGTAEAGMAAAAVEAVDESGVAGPLSGGADSPSGVADPQSGAADPQGGVVDPQLGIDDSQPAAAARPDAAPMLAGAAGGAQPG